MAFLDRLRGMFRLGSGSQEFKAASQVDSFAEPRVRAGNRARPSWMTSASMPNDLIRVPDRNVASTDVSRMSRALGTRQIVRDLVHTSPDISAALNSYLRTAITAGYYVVARNPDGTSNKEATKLAWGIVNKLDAIPDFSQGFVNTSTLRSCSESIGKEQIMYGAMAVELVLDSARLPVRIEPLSVTNIQFRPKGQRLAPVQVVGGDEFDLDVPTVFFSSLDKELTQVYATSPLESAIKPTFFAEEFMADLQRVVKRSIHPRLQVVVDPEEVRKYAPAEAMHSQEKMDEYITEQLSLIEQMINSMNPEDAVVAMGFMKISYLNNGNISVSREWDVLQDLTNAKTATGAKVLPSVLGHNTGSSNIASTETLLFMKNVEGMLQLKLNELYSRVLTLAVRLYGVDCYVEFWYEPINLRPTDELEAFKAQKQSRILELLSLGLITDEDASLALTGFLPPEGMTPLAGTRFKSQNASDANPYEGASNSGSTLNQNLQSDAPAGVRGGNNRANPQKESQ